jgi:hypothetical protein
MRLLKIAILGSLLVAVLALASGVVTILDERPDGTVALAPRVSRPAARWYAAKVAAAAVSARRRVAQAVR